MIIAAVLLRGSYAANAQGLSVNTTGAAADASAMLDISSTSKGMLTPRMTTAQRTAISSPATGLLVYQTDGTAGFYFYNGAAWISLNTYSTAGGDLTGTYPSPTLVASGVTAGTYGSSTAIPVLTIDAKGRATTAATATVPLFFTTSFTYNSGTSGNNRWYYPLGGSYAGGSPRANAQCQVPFAFTVTSMEIVIAVTTYGSGNILPEVTLYDGNSATTMDYTWTTALTAAGTYTSGTITPTAVAIAAGDLLSIGYKDVDGGSNSCTENVMVTFYGHY